MLPKSNKCTEEDSKIRKIKSQTNILTNTKKIGISTTNKTLFNNKLLK